MKDTGTLRSESTTARMEQSFDLATALARLTGYRRDNSQGNYCWRLDEHGDVHLEIGEHSARGIKKALQNFFNVNSIIESPDYQPKLLPNGAAKLTITVHHEQVGSETLKKMEEEARNESPFSPFRNELRNAIAKETSSNRSFY